MTLDANDEVALRIAEQLASAGRAVLLVADAPALEIADRLLGLDSGSRSYTLTPDERRRLIERAGQLSQLSIFPADTLDMAKEIESFAFAHRDRGVVVVTNWRLIEADESSPRRIQELADRFEIPVVVCVQAAKARDRR